MKKPIKLEPVLRLHLLAVAKAYAAGHKLKMSTVSSYANGGAWFFKNLEAGKVSFTLRKYDSMIEYFADNWPEGVDVPKPPFSLPR